nr:hypothetical protein [Methanobacterium formicicum]
METLLIMIKAVEIIRNLKKITKWDGRQYSLVSRYALRYSLLETAKNMSLWKLAGGEDLTAAGSGDKKVIQPAVDFFIVW